jgi:hypothetical protein
MTLTAFSALPDAVEKGDNTTAARLTTHEHHGAVFRYSWLNRAKRALAIAAFLGTNLISAVNVVGIKECIAALGVCNGEHNGRVLGNWADVAGPSGKFCGQQWLRGGAIRVERGFGMGCGGDVGRKRRLWPYW